MEHLDDPSADGWPSEVLSEQAKDQLKRLGKLILHPGQRDDAALRQIVAEGFSFDGLEPKGSEVVYTDSALTVERMAAQPAATPRRGIAEIEAAIGNIGTLLVNAAEPRFEVKVFRVQQETDSFTTQQYVEISGITKTGVIEQHATWRTRWTMSAGDSPPRLLQLDVSDVEQVTSRTGGRTLFSDCTQSVLGSNASYQQQIGRGFNHWLHRTQDTQYFFWLGIPGVALGDVNGDGLDDLYLCQEDGLPNRLYLQNADGTLRDESEAAGVNWLEGSRSALLVDLDNDGDQDLAVAIMGGIVLAANRGDGHFDYRALLPTSHDLMSLSAADYDQDGRLDLYVCTYWRNGSAGPESGSSGVVTGRFVYHDSNVGGYNSLFRNETTDLDGWNFREVTAEVGLDSNNGRWSLAAAWEDYDNDGDQDLYVANDFGRNCLYRNDGGKFVDVAGEADVEDSASGMAVTWGDYNRDGWMDVYISNMFSAAGNRITFQEQFKPNASPEVRARLRRFARGSTLLKNLDNRSFGDVSEVAGVARARWAWGTSFIDINNNGWEDLVVANGNVTGDDPEDL
ncbi:MAG: VCBS repeat-containing protein [Roseibacillus sp.]